MRCWQRWGCRARRRAVEGAPCRRACPPPACCGPPAAQARLYLAAADAGARARQRGARGGVVHAWRGRRAGGADGRARLPHQGPPVSVRREAERPHGPRRAVGAVAVPAFWPAGAAARRHRVRQVQAHPQGAAGWMRGTRAGAELHGGAAPRARSTLLVHPARPTHATPCPPHPPPTLQASVEGFLEELIVRRELAGACRGCAGAAVPRVTRRAGQGSMPRRGADRLGTPCATPPLPFPVSTRPTQPPNQTTIASTSTTTTRWMPRTTGPSRWVRGRCTSEQRGACLLSGGSAVQPNLAHPHTAPTTLVCSPWTPTATTSASTCTRGATRWRLPRLITHPCMASAHAHPAHVTPCRRPQGAV